nr:FMN-binding glutamate synthase family protein [Chloroherpeton thalassium]
MRTPKHRNLFDEILFLPGQLARRPLRPDEVAVNLKTIIGAQSAKPIELALPFFVSHMSFGSLSKEAKIALAKGSAMAKTATCSGEGGMIDEEQQAAYKYIFEYSTGRFGVTDDALKKCDAVEIKIGQAAKAGLGGHLLAEKVTEEIARVRKVPPFQDIISPANHTDIKSEDDLRKKVNWLREKIDGKPVGIKLVAGNLEDDLEVALYAQPDFITIDCRGGSTGAAPAHVKDNFGIPAPYAVYQARKIFREKQVADTALILTGGIRTTADIAKCIAMGADAVALGTTAMIGIGCQQYRVCHKGTCPVGIATQDPKLRERFNIEESAKMLANLFLVYKSELEDIVRILGRKNIHDLEYSDLVTLSREISEYTDIAHA